MVSPTHRFTREAPSLVRQDALKETVNARTSIGPHLADTDFLMM